MQQHHEGVVMPRHFQEGVIDVSHGEVMRFQEVVVIREGVGTT